MSPDFRLVPDASQAQADILSAQGPGNTFAQTGLAGSGRPRQQQDGSSASLFQLQHRQILENSLFDLFQSVVILLQNLPGLFQIYRNILLLFPGKFQTEIQIIADHTFLRAALPQGLQTVRLLQQFLPDVLRHRFLPEPLPVILFLFSPASSVLSLLLQLLLNRLQLLPQHLVAVEAIGFICHFFIEFHAQLHRLLLLQQIVHKQKTSFLQGVRFQIFILPFSGNMQVAAHVGNQGVDILKIL